MAGSLLGGLMHLSAQSTAGLAPANFFCAGYLCSPPDARNTLHTAVLLYFAQYTIYVLLLVWASVLRLCLFWPRVKEAPMRRGTKYCEPNSLELY